MKGNAATHQVNGGATMVRSEPIGKYARDQCKSRKPKPVRISGYTGVRVTWKLDRFRS